jgi:hypothetical protein
MVVAVLFVTVSFGVAPIKSYAANNEGIQITIGTTSYSITSATVLKIPYNLTGTTHISTTIYLEESKNGLWVKSDLAYSESVHDSNYTDVGPYATSGTFETKSSASSTYYIPAGTHIFRLATEGGTAHSPSITVKVSKVTPKLTVSNITITPSYDAGKGTIEGDYTVSGYEDTNTDHWVLQYKSGSKWKTVASDIYGYTQKFYTKKMTIGTAKTFRLAYKGDDYANKAYSKSFALFKTKVTAKITGSKSFKSYKQGNLTVKLSKKTSGAITVYLKGSSIGTVTFKNKKTVKVPATFYGSGKGKVYVKFTSGNKNHKNATSKKVTITVKK